MRFPKLAHLARSGLRLLLGLLIALAGLMGQQVPAQAANINIKVLNASPDTGPIDLYDGPNRLAAGVAFRAFSPAVSVPEGQHLFRVFPANADPNTTPPIVQFNVGLPPSFSYVVGISNRRAAITPIAVTDQPPAPTGYFNFRVINLSPDTPSVDLLRVINASTQRPVIEDVIFGNAKTLRLRSSLTYTFRVRRFGTDEILMELPAQRFPSRGRPTLWLFNAVAGARKFSLNEQSNNEQFILTND